MSFHLKKLAGASAVSIILAFTGQPLFAGSGEGETKYGWGGTPDFGFLSRFGVWEGPGVASLLPYLGHPVRYGASWGVRPDFMGYQGVALWGSNPDYVFEGGGGQGLPGYPHFNGNPNIRPHGPGAYHSPPIVGYQMVPVYAPAWPVIYGQPHPGAAVPVPGAQAHAGPPQPIICMVNASQAANADTDPAQIAVIAQTTEACGAIGGEVKSIAGNAAAAEPAGSASDNN